LSFGFLSTVFNFWVFNLGSIGSLLSQDNLANSFLQAAEPVADQGFESEPDMVEVPEPSLAEPVGLVGLEPEPEEKDANAEANPNPDAEQTGGIGDIVSLPNQEDPVDSFLPPEEQATDLEPEPELDSVEILAAGQEQPPASAETGGTDLNPEALQTDPLAGIGSLPNSGSLPNLDELLNPFRPPAKPDEPATEVDPEPEPDGVEESESEDSDTSAGADPNPEAGQSESMTESPSSTTPSATTSSSTSISTKGDASSMVTTSSVSRSEVTGLGDAVVAIAAGIDLRAGSKQGRDSVRFTLTRSGDTSGESSVAWAVRGQGDNPAAARDFRGKQLPSGTVTFAAGETSSSVSVRVRPSDGQKGFALTLDKAKGAVLGRSTARATIAPRDNLIGTDSNDRIQGSKRAEEIEGRAGRDLLTGGSKADRFGFRFGDSLIASPDRITDHRLGEDRIAVLNGKGQPQGLPRRFSRAADNSTASTLEDLAAAVFADADGRRAGNQALGRREAAVVVSTNAQIAGTYLLINNGKAGLNPRNDLLIDISGFSGDLPGLGRIDPAVVFA
jgi:hypothetical protein